MVKVTWELVAETGLLKSERITRVQARQMWTDLLEAAATGGSDLLAVFDKYDDKSGLSRTTGTVMSATVKERLTSGEWRFFPDVYVLYKRRELTPSQLEALVAEGLKAYGNYKMLANAWGVAEQKGYKKFVNFLNNQEIGRHRLRT